MKIVNKDELKIYYAHHIWKYDTYIEYYELDIIKENFPNSDIINPNGYLEAEFGVSESELMDKCFEIIEKCDVLIFSSVDGIIGYGVFTEIETALEKGIPLYYIYQGKLHDRFRITELEDSIFKLYAKVDIVERTN